ncbi:class 3 adenylate cyclase [Actinoplanes tereljensis]|uniref:Uncharacterized protein n=1 Tax=Paractinoplanes tereljensis TaxID=571912 RepID=A0A919NW67_9ACTN|nr:hypothetical protein [Actinoplanes tereljensis]GIF24522.1 hypothetical protein Ate02nite_72520 [Actinoplanes tereljensis]
MTNSTEFEEAFTDFVRSTGRWRDCGPESLTRRWADFVDECVRGYDRDGGDYFNDLTARDALEKALRNPGLAGFDEMRSLAAAVAMADEEFKAELRPNAFLNFPESEWWVRGIVRRAGPRLAEYLRRNFNIEIDAI